MGSRLLPLVLAVGAVSADMAGAHRPAFYLVLLAVPAAAAAALLGAGDVIQGEAAWLRGVSTSLALVLLVAGSAVRESAAAGAGVPALAVSSVVAAVVVYAVPFVVWLLEPLVPRPRPRYVRPRAQSAPYVRP